MNFETIHNGVITHLKLEDTRLDAEKKFEITGLTPMVGNVFKLTRMDEVFRVHNTVGAPLL